MAASSEGDKQKKSASPKGNAHTDNNLREIFEMNTTKKQLTLTEKNDIRDAQITAKIRTRQQEVFSQNGRGQLLAMLNQAAGVQHLTERQRNYLMNI